MKVMSEDARGCEQDGQASAGPQSELAGRKLYRSRDDRMIAGVCGGLGAYLGVDPVVIRLSFVTMVFVGGLAIPLYVIAWFLVPDGGDSAAARAAPLPILDALLVGLGGSLVAVGAALLSAPLAPWSDDRFVWVLVIVAIGVFLLFRGMRR